MYPQIFLSHDYKQIIERQQSSGNNESHLNILIKMNTGQYIVKWLQYLKCRSIFKIQQQQKQFLMISSHSKLLTEKKYCTITIHRPAQTLTILIVDQINDIVLISKVEKNDLPSIFFQLFSEQIQQLYKYLAKDECLIKIIDFEGQIRIQYALQTFKKQNIVKYFSLVTKKYSRSILNANQILTTKIQQITQQKFEQMPNHNNIIDCISDFTLFNNKQTLKAIQSIQNHQNWYINLQPNLCIQLSNKLSTFNSNKLQSIIYRLSINLNQFHSEQIPRYDFTIGFATHEKIAEMRVTVEPNFANTISASVENRSIISHCISLKEQKSYNKVISPKRVQLLVTIDKTYTLMIESVKVIMLNQTEQILVNVFNGSSLAAIKSNFIKFDQFFPFVYFSRSLLHFNFGN